MATLEERLASLEAKIANIVHRTSDGGDSPTSAATLDHDLENQKQHVRPPPVHHDTGIADPGPLGLFAFGITTTMLNFKNASVTEPASMGMIVCYGMFYGGFIQLLAGLLEFKNKNVFGATVFSSYGGFWMGLSLWDILAAAKVLPAGSAFPAGRALWLSVWGLLSIALFFPTLRMNRVLQSTFISLIILFYLLAGGVYNETCEKIAGAVGIYCGLSALYVGYANLLKAMYGKWIIPVGDCSGGKH